MPSQPIQINDPTAILAGALFMTGCESATNTVYEKGDTVTIPPAWDFQPPSGVPTAENIRQLKTWLADSTGVYTGVDFSGALLSEAITIPTGKTLYLSDGGTLTTAVNIEVTGGALVIYGGTTTVNGAGSLKITSGTAKVETGGTLRLTAGALTDITGTVTFVVPENDLGGATAGTLDIGTVGTAANITTAHKNYVGRGILAGRVSSAKITEVVAAVGTTEADITIIYTTDEAAETAISIPANLYLHAGLVGGGNITGITVNGRLEITSSTTLTGVTAITLGEDGYLSAGGTTFNTATGTSVTLGTDAFFTGGTISKLKNSFNVSTKQVFGPTAFDGLTSGDNAETVTYKAGRAGLYEPVYFDIDMVVRKISAADGFVLKGDHALATGRHIVLGAGYTPVTLTVPAGVTLSVAGTLSVGAGSTVALGGTATTAGGTLTLVKHATTPGKFEVAAGMTAGKLTTGASTGGATNIASVVDITIGGKAVTNTGFVATDWKLDGAGTGKSLQQLGGTTAGSIAAGADGDVVIDSTKAVASFAGPVITPVNESLTAGALSIGITGTDFNTSATLADFTIGGAASAKVRSVEAGATTTAINFTTTALTAGDVITIQAKTSAFTPNASAASNQVTFNAVAAATVPAFTSATYDVVSGALVINGTNLPSTGTDDATKFTLGTHTLTSQTTNPIFSSAASFTITVDGTDKSTVNALTAFTTNGDKAGGLTRHQLSHRRHWRGSERQGDRKCGGTCSRHHIG